MDINLASPAVAWTPPHPQKGTPYHRYVTLLLPQLHSSQPIAIAPEDIEERSAFDVRAFMTKHQLGYYSQDDEGVQMRMVPQTYADRAGKGLAGGIHMWRAIWDEDVSKIYRDVLSE